MSEPTSTVKMLREFESAEWIDDGYAFMDAGHASGWRPVAGWGEDGWDLGDWPYVVVLFRERRDPDHDSSRCDPICVLAGETGSDFCPTVYERAIYVEGDITVETWDSREGREDSTAIVCAFYLSRYSDADLAGDFKLPELVGWKDGDPVPDRLRHPYGHTTPTAHVAGQG